MIPRLLQAQLVSLRSQYPVLAVVGPRQSGKSTLCAASFPGLPVVNLELPDVRERVASDPRQFVADHRGGCVIDEIQYLPQLLSYIQAAVDARKTNGEFILTGSQQYPLMAAVAQSLAGRVAIVRLLPLSIEELQQADRLTVRLEERLWRGGYPRVIHESLDPSQAYSFYVQTYLERDVRQVTQVQDLGLFERFVRLCAARSGQLLNVTNLANEAAVDQTTVQRWLGVLETSFILTRVAPHHDNLSKRLVKAPKLFFLDTGVLCYLLGIRHPDQLAQHPLRGAIVETYVASELVKLAFNRVRDPGLYFYRDRTGHEVDFVIERGDSVCPIEVKASSTFTGSFLEHLLYYGKLPRSRARNPCLIYTGAEEFTVEGVRVLPLDRLAELAG